MFAVARIEFDQPCEVGQRANRDIQKVLLDLERERHPRRRQQESRVELRRKGEHGAGTSHPKNWARYEPERPKRGREHLLRHTLSHSNLDTGSSVSPPELGPVRLPLTKGITPPPPTAAAAEQTRLDQRSQLVIFIFNFNEPIHAFDDQRRRETHRLDTQKIQAARSEPHLGPRRHGSALGYSGPGVTGGRLPEIARPL